MAIQVKICGLTRAEDAAFAAAEGATYGGVILAPGSPRTLDPARAATVLDGGALIRCGVFVDPGMDELLQAVATARLDVVQLHGDESAEWASRAAAESGKQVWKAIRPRTGAEFAAGVERYAGAVDAILLDGWSPHARGGTGQPFPWTEVAALRYKLPPGTRLVVAGGLTGANVAEVVRLLEPDAVDVSSGVESSPGVKDPEKVRRFIEAAGAGMQAGR